MVRPIPWVCILCLTALVGCTSTKTSNTARTAREQMLVSNAIDQSLAKIDFTALQGSKVFLEDKYLECIDKGYLIGSVRHRAMVNGAQLVAKAEDADIVLELRSGAVGTDTADSFVGTPEITLPGMMSVPEMRLISRNKQSAMAKIGIVAYDAKTRELLGAGGVSSSLSRDHNWYVMGVGPYQEGEVKSEIVRTTGRRAGQPYQELPASIAFQAPDSASDPNRLQLTGEEQPE
jgi:hypothetical protein